MGLGGVARSRQGVRTTIVAEGATRPVGPVGPVWRNFTTAEPHQLWVVMSALSG